MRAIDADTLKYDIVEEGQRSKRYKIGEFWELNRDEIWKVIDEQPTIEPERKKGEWIRWYEEIESSSCTDYIPHCKCSECGTDINARSSLFIKFCPYCGAEMSE